MKLVALISGSGTTLQNLIDRTADGRLPAEIVGAVSSRADAFGVQRATAAGLSVAVVEKAGGGRKSPDGATGQTLSARPEPPSGGLRPPPADFSDRVFAAVRAFGPDVVCLAGWLHLIRIPADFRHRVLNIHPSLLPAFGGKGMYGRHVHEAVLAYGAKVSGCTVHLADDSYDTGPIVLQQPVPVLDDDTPDTLAARVFAAECDAYPEAIRLVGEGRVRVDGRRVVGQG